MASTKKSPRTSRTRKKTDPPVHWFLRYHVTLWVIVLALTGLAAVVALRLPQQKVVSQPAVPQATANKVAPRPARIPVIKPRPSLQYEEETRTLETRVKELDLALIQTLVVYGYDPVGIVHGNVETRYRHGHEYHFQHLELALPRDMDALLASLRKNIHDLVRGGHMRYDARANQVTLLVDDLPTHVIDFGEPARVPRSPGKKDACMVIVVDDLGRSLDAGKRLVDLSFPVTFSVMPYEPHSPEVAKLARGLVRGHVSPGCHPDRARGSGPDSRSQWREQSHGIAIYQGRAGHGGGHEGVQGSSPVFSGQPDNGRQLWGRGNLQIPCPVFAKTCFFGQCQG
jgi:hypothetical protein